MRLIEVHDRHEVDSVYPYYRFVTEDENEIAEIRKLCGKKNLILIDRPLDTFAKAKSWLESL